MTPAGSHWLPALPVGWQILPAKALFSERSNPSLATDEHLTPSQKYGVVSQSDYMETTGSRVVLNLTGADNMKHVEPGDFVIHLRSFQGGLERSMLRGKVSQAYTVLRPRQLVQGSFFKYLLKSDRYVQSLRVIVNQLRDGQSIRYQDFSRIPLPLPPGKEQVRIADFLDRETAKIDDLIEKQQGLMSGLLERRTAIANDLLQGEASWDVIPLQRLATAVVDCPHWTPEVTEDSGFEAVRSGSIRDGAYLPEESLSVSEDVFRARERGVPILPSDVLLAREAPAGEACLAPIGRRLCLGQRTVHVRVDRLRIAPELVIANIYCQPVRDYFKTQTNGSTVGNLRLPVIRRTPVIVPPLDIQPRLVAKYRDALAGIDHLTERADQFIRVSRERRAALITAAVTGQLDVSKGQVV